MKKVLIGLTLGLILFTSCKREPTEVVKTNNTNFNVELLFEVDGCKVYRFWDGGYKYFTTCNGSVNWKTGDKHSYNKEIPTTIK
jgi:hypothetical protein